MMGKPQSTIHPSKLPKWKIFKIVVTVAVIAYQLFLAYFAYQKRQRHIFTNDRKLQVAIVNTRATHDEVIVPLLDAWLLVPFATVTSFQKGYRFGMDRFIVDQGMPSAMRDSIHVDEFHEIGRSSKHPIPDVIVSTTCILDIGTLNETYTLLLRQHHTHLFCLIHAGNETLGTEEWEHGIVPWIKAKRISLVVLSPHVEDFLKTHVTIGELETPIHVFLPIFEFVPKSYDEQPVTDRNVGFSIQGKYSQGRNYTSVLNRLDTFIEDSRKRGESTDRINLHLVGTGEHPEIPDDLQDHVIFDERLDYIQFYSTLAHTDAILTAFRGDEYYTSKASSTIPASLISGTPLLADKNLMRAYAFLTEDVVWMQKDGESDIDTVGRVLALSQEKRNAKKAAVKKFTKDMIHKNRLLVQAWALQIARCALEQ